jgi:NAD(P)-dependent dehydrogenase (short-subunit alcohol dehydrogenase family)
VERLEKLAQELGGPDWARAVVCDVTIDGDCERVVAETLARFGRIDVVMANAGFGISAPFELLKLEDFRRQFETNFYGVIRTAQAARGALEQTQGTLALTASVAGMIGLPGGSPYSASKFAVRALGESLRAEWAHKGVSVTLLSPGFVESEIRLVDNQGQFHEEFKDPIPSWLVVPRDAAAREMIRATERRVAERVITGHGKVLAFLSRHFPWVTRLVLPGMAPKPGDKSWHRASKN